MVIDGSNMGGLILVPIRGINSPVDGLLGEAGDTCFAPDIMALQPVSKIVFSEYGPLM